MALSTGCLEVCVMFRLVGFIHWHWLSVCLSFLFVPTLLLAVETLVWILASVVNKIKHK